MPPTLSASSPALESLKAGLTGLSRAQVAHIGREVLSLLAPVIEGVPTNIIVHQGEVFLFGQLDSLLAKIEAPAIVPAADPNAAPAGQ